LQAKHPSFDDSQNIFIQISELIGEGVGEKSTPEELAAIYKEGETRYQNKVPPGYNDSSKPTSEEKFGDLTIWKSLLERAKSANRPIILITDDAKEDWWLDYRGKKISPRPELIEEMMSYANQPFYMYNLSKFLEFASEHLTSRVDKTAIQEIKTDEEVQRRGFRITINNAEQIKEHARGRVRTALLRDSLGQMEHEITALEARIDVLGNEIRYLPLSAATKSSSHLMKLNTSNYFGEGEICENALHSTAVS
jgi:hypothetical protein